MSILGNDFDFNEDNLYRDVFLDYIVRKSKYHQVILLLDPDKMVDMQALENKINNDQDNGMAMFCDMSECQASNYVPFVIQLTRPFAQGAIDYLLLDNIDKIPDSEMREEFEQLLKYMAKREDYDPLQNITETNEKRVTLDFSKEGRLIMRCSKVPEFLQNFTYIMIDCRNYAQLVNEKDVDSEKQSSFAGRGSGKFGIVRLEDCIPPKELKDLPNIGFPSHDIISREIGNKIAEAEGYPPL